MWFDFDVCNFARMLLPPILRGPVMAVIVGTLVLPIKYLYNSYKEFYIKTHNKLMNTANVESLEKALNDLFFLEFHQIYISTPNAPLNMYWHFYQERMPPLYLSNKYTAYFREKDDVPLTPTFIVHVPTFLCTSLEQDTDRYKGVYINQIYNTLNYYKPAGRSYRIELYDYYE